MPLLSGISGPDGKFPLAYTKININVKVGVPNEEIWRRSEQ
jgi:hypothetical protein